MPVLYSFYLLAEFFHDVWTSVHRVVDPLGSAKPFLGAPTKNFFGPAPKIPKCFRNRRGRRQGTFLWDDPITVSWV